MTVRQFTIAPARGLGVVRLGRPDDGPLDKREIHGAAAAQAAARLMSRPVNSPSSQPSA